MTAKSPSPDKKLAKLKSSNEKLKKELEDEKTSRTKDKKKIKDLKSQIELLEKEVKNARAAAEKAKNEKLQNSASKTDDKKPEVIQSNVQRDGFLLVPNGKQFASLPRPKFLKGIAVFQLDFKIDVNYCFWRKYGLLANRLIREKGQIKRQKIHF